MMSQSERGVCLYWFILEMAKIEIERDEYVKLKADLDLAAQNGLKLLKENINLKSEAKTKKEEVTSLQNLLEKGFRETFENFLSR